MDIQEQAPHPPARPGAGSRERTPLELFEASGLLAAAGNWSVIGLGVGMALAVLVAVVVVDRPWPVLAVIAVAGVAHAMLLSRPGWFLRWAEFVTIFGVVAAGMMTGGGASPFRLFLVFPFVWSSVTRELPAARVVWLTAAGGRFLLAAVDGLTLVEWGLALLEVGLWATIAMGIWALREAVGRALADRQRSEDVHRALVEGHSSGVYVLDADFQVVEVNDALLRLVGWQREEAIGRNVLSFVPPEFHDDAIEFAGRAMRGLPTPYESVALTKGGDRIPMLVTHARIVVDGQVQGLFGILQDLRGLQEERAEKVAVQRRFVRMAESSTDGMFVISLRRDRLEVEYANPALVDMFGLDPTGSPDAMDVIARGLDAHDRRRMLTHLRLAEPGPPLTVRYRRPDGDVRWLAIQDAWHEDATGTRIGRQGIVRDVTREREEHEALAEALAMERRAGEQLRRTQQMQSTFLQSLSHELRTPLTSISGMLATLRQRGVDLSERDAVALVERAEANAQRLAALLVDLLDLEDRARDVATVVEGVDPVVPQEAQAPPAADLAVEVDQVVRALAQGEGRISLQLHSARVVVGAEGARRITRALVENAIHHAGSAPIRVRVGTQEDLAVLTVEDEGPGISEDLLPTVFEPFVQGAQAIDAANPGTGIGLAVARRLVESGGGTIIARNGVAGGACFEVRLPLAKIT